MKKTTKILEQRARDIHRAIRAFHIGSKPHKPLPIEQKVYPCGAIVVRGKTDYQRRKVHYRD